MRDASKTRERIHQAALDLFVRQGVTETSVRDLTQAAGIAEGTLYRHYASKDELVADLFASNYTAFARRLDALQRPLPSLRAKIDAIVAELFRFHDSDPTLFRFLLLVQHQALQRLSVTKDNPVLLLQSLVEQGIADGKIRIGDAALGATIVLGLLLQPATAILYGRLSPPLSRFTSTIAEACWRALDPAEDGGEVR